MVSWSARLAKLIKLVCVDGFKEVLGTCELLKKKKKKKHLGF